MDTATDSRSLVSTVRNVQRVPLGELADHADETRAERSEGEFNSSI